MASGSPLFVTALFLASVLFCTCDLVLDGDEDGSIARERRQGTPLNVCTSIRYYHYARVSAQCPNGLMSQATTNALPQPIYSAGMYLFSNSTYLFSRYVPIFKLVSIKIQSIWIITHEALILILLLIPEAPIFETKWFSIEIELL